MHSMFFRKGAKREAGVNPARSRHCGMGSVLCGCPLAVMPGRCRDMQ